MPTAKDAIDELVERSKDCKELRAFHELHRGCPEILDFLVLEIRARIAAGLQVFAYRSLWEYTRSKLRLRRNAGEDFVMNDHAAPFYARAIVILHPEFNGMAEMRKSKADAIFGVELGPATNVRDNGARWLFWADGTPISANEGWRPSIPHTPKLPTNRRPDVHARAQSAEHGLGAAARMVSAQRDALANGAPLGILNRLDAIAAELRGIEESL